MCQGNSISLLAFNSRTCLKYSFQIYYLQVVIGIIKIELTFAIFRLIYESKNFLDIE